MGQKISDVQKYHIDIFAIGSDWMGAFDYISDYCKSSLSGKDKRTYQAQCCVSRTDISRK